MPLCLAISLCYLTFYYALDAGELSITSAILGTYPMYTVLFAVFVMGEVIVSRQWGALIAIIAGVGLLSYLCSQTPANEEADIASIKPAARGWLYIALSSAVLMGTADAMCKVIIDNSNVSAFSLYLNTMQIAAGIALKLLFEGRNFCFEALKSKYSLIGLLILNIGGLAFTLALSAGQASIIVPLSSSYLVIVTILSWLFLKEEMSIFKAFAIAVVVAGIMAL